MTKQHSRLIEYIEIQIMLVNDLINSRATSVNMERPDLIYLGWKVRLAALEEILKQNNDLNNFFNLPRLDTAVSIDQKNTTPNKPRE